MRIKRNVNAITRAICDTWRNIYRWKCAQRNQYASINNYIRVCNRVYKLASNGEHGEDIERLLALGPEIIESTTITKVNCCYTLARITAEFIVCLIVRSWSILLLAQRNLDERLITINDRWIICEVEQRVRRFPNTANVSIIFSCVFDTREHLKTIVRFFLRISNWNFCWLTVAFMK